ncbi:MAG: hypothetical protein ACOC4K_02890 [Verrucomicrobiota bacterium]
MTFLDLKLRVAEFLGVAYYGASGVSAASAPTSLTSLHDSDMVGRIVNDGWRRFVTSRPRWNWMAPTFTITFDPDGSTSRTVDDPGDQSLPRASRYFLPWGFSGRILGEMSYARNDARRSVRQVQELEIRNLFAGAGTVSGDPYLYAIRPLPPSAQPESESRRWEMLLYPTPDGTDTITGRCAIWPDRMVLDNDRHAAGFQHDQAVLAACMAEAEYQRLNRHAAMWDEWERCLSLAIEQDRNAAPDTVGYNGNGPSRVGGRPYTGVDSYVNLDGTTHAFSL